MSILSKLAAKFSKKYSLITQGQAQVGADDQAKFKIALNAMARIVAFLQHPEYKKLLGGSQAAATNVLSLYQMISGKMNQFYNPGTQRYDVPQENVVNFKSFLDSVVPDVEKAVVQIKSFVPPDQQTKLQFYLDSFTENVRQIEGEVFTP